MTQLLTLDVTANLNSMIAQATEYAANLVDPTSPVYVTVQGQKVSVKLIQPNSFKPHSFVYSVKPTVGFLVKLKTPDSEINFSEMTVVKQLGVSNPIVIFPYLSGIGHNECKKDDFEFLQGTTTLLDVDSNKLKEVAIQWKELQRARLIRDTLWSLRNKLEEIDK